MDTHSSQNDNLTIEGALDDRYRSILTEATLDFLKELHRQFNAERKKLLKNREDRQKRIAAGEIPDFLSSDYAKEVRQSNWKVAKIPSDLLDRRIELTGPVDRKMIINGLNAGAQAYMADLEDSNSPTWSNVIEGQINLKDAVNRNITYQDPNSEKNYALDQSSKTLLIVRPRGWHLEEKNILLGGERMSASLVDFGIFFFHNAKTLIERGTGPYFYLPKMESHLEARLWQRVFDFSEKKLGINHGTIKATVLIETILASFELDEILYELKDYCVGFNCGRWDYIFSYIKRLHPLKYILPNRREVTMATPFMRQYSLEVVKTCHKRGAFAIGGMAAQIPRNDDPSAQKEIEKTIRQGKQRELDNGHDGTWVAHPGLIPIVADVYEKHLGRKTNQVDRLRNDVVSTASSLLQCPEGTIDESGVRENIYAAIIYLANWLCGRGCVAINYLMEDAATVEISRSQLWQWAHEKVKLADGRVFDHALYEKISRDEIEKIKKEIGEQDFSDNRYPKAIEIFDNLVKRQTFSDFLTTESYEHII